MLARKERYLVLSVACRVRLVPEAVGPHKPQRPVGIEMVA
jgi:hypothetical protein